jgi:hypothetical protein
MVVLRPDPVVVDDKLSIDLMWLFIRAGRCSFSEFIERFGLQVVGEFLAGLDEAGLHVAIKEPAQ